MANENRIYYATQSVQLNGPSGKNIVTNTAWDTVRGLQSVGINTNFNLEPIYQLGQLSLYDNYEEIPEVEISLNKVLDGSQTIYAMTMGTGQLTKLSDHRCGFRLNLYPEASGSTSGGGFAYVECVPAYLSSVTYSFPSEGNCTEEVSLVSNDKVWTNDTKAGFTTVGDTAPTITEPLKIADNPAIIRRGLISGLTIPTGAGGGTGGYESGGIPTGMKVQSMNISMNLGRESIYKLGQRTPYYRYVNFPVEITCEIECIAGDGDLAGLPQPVAGNPACQNPKALSNKAIAIQLCDGMKIDLGDKCKLSSVNYQGGDTGGGNVTVTYSYITYNDFTYTAPTGHSYPDVVEDNQSFPLT
jgi:hypothetical protein